MGFQPQEVETGCLLIYQRYDEGGERWGAGILEIQIGV